MNWYLEVLKKYAEFNGRARRKEYWMFVLFNTIVAFSIVLLGLILSGISNNDSILSIFIGVYVLYLLAVIIPSISVGVRRLHDIGKSGWWMLISFIPIIGGIWLFILTVTEGNSGVNKYGSNPKGF